MSAYEHLSFCGMFEESGEENTYRAGAGDYIDSRKPHAWQSVSVVERAEERSWSCKVP